MADRELIEPNPGDKRYMPRDDRRRFKEVDDVSRSLAGSEAQGQGTSNKGQGDKGDRKGG